MGRSAAHKAPLNGEGGVKKVPKARVFNHFLHKSTTSIFKRKPWEDPPRTLSSLGNCPTPAPAAHSQPASAGRSAGRAVARLTRKRPTRAPRSVGPAPTGLPHPPRGPLPRHGPAPSPPQSGRRLTARPQPADPPDYLPAPAAVVCPPPPAGGQSLRRNRAARC